MIRFPFPRQRRGEDEPEAGGEDPLEGRAPEDQAGGGSESASTRASEPPPAPLHVADEAAARITEALEGDRAADAAPEADATELDPRAASAPDMAEQERMVEAMLFASDQPLSTAELASRMPIGCDAAVAVRRLEERYAGRGVTLARVAGKWAFRTASDLAHLLVGEAVEQRKLSRAAIETLAIIAYHQPTTRAEIEEIRQVGVSKGTIDLLMELEWIKLGRRRQTPGRPVTFVTTDKFLEHFGFETTRDLPRLEELRQAGLLDNRPPVGFEPSGEVDAEDLDQWEDDEEDDADGQGEQDLLV